MRFITRALCCLWAAGALSLPGQAERAQGADLRLIPFPKEAHLDGTNFPLARRLVLEISQDQAAILGEQLKAELTNAGYPAPVVRPIKTAFHVLRLAPRIRWSIKRLPLRASAPAEEYALQIQPAGVTITSAGREGLFYGAQTLRQLIRANRQNNALPGLSIHDWPSMPWRAFQDDLTRGPSSTLQNLQEQASLGAFLKLNIFTYYMEFQYAFAKHPEIGPKNGSLTSDELAALVSYARPLELNILGNQQSFGHFDAILSHPQFQELRETPGLLNPANPRTYKLLDDLYSEVIPHLPFQFFNVCCDETDGLGEGPSKELARQIGVGGVYVQHIQRVHDLVSGKYHKQMMMWGDIILRHATNLNQVPKDTIMMTWGYDPRASFEDHMVPFEKAGYKFFVCPGVNNWNRVLPHFGAAMTNIHNFVRDGLKHGAIGMLNTAWDDDGQSFNAPNWHANAWAAECAWNGSTTTQADFNRRIGAVLFGEKSDRFGQAITTLASSPADGMPSSAFWNFDFSALKVRSADLARTQWEKQLESVRAALAGFQAAQQDATLNRGLLDYYVFGAKRMELSLRRDLNRLNAALAYRDARRKPLAQAIPLLTQIEEGLRADRDALEALSRTFQELWHRENKPYALDRGLNAYQILLSKYDRELELLAKVRTSAKPDRSLPTPREVGLELVEDGK